MLNASRLKLKSIFSRRLSKEILLYSTASFIALVVPFALLPILTRVFSQADFGYFGIFQSIVNIVGKLVAFGTCAALIRSYALIEKSDRSTYFASCLFVVSITATVVIFLFSVLAVKDFAWLPFDSNWLLCAAAAGIFCAIWNLSLSHMQGLRQAAKYANWQVVSALVSFLVTLVLVFGFDLTWKGRAVAVLLSFLAPSLVLLVSFFKKGFASYSISKSFVREASIIGIAAMPHALSAVVMSFTDRFLILNMVGAEEAGLYTVAYQVSSVFLVVGVAIGRGWSPWVYEQLKPGGNAIAKNKLMNYCLVLIGFLVSSGVIFLIVANAFLPALLGEEFEESRKFTTILIASCVTSTLYIILAPPIFFYKKLAFLGVAGVVLLIANVILTYVLILDLGSVGAAYATLASKAGLLLFTLFFSVFLVRREINSSRC